MQQKTLLRSNELLDDDEFALPARDIVPVEAVVAIDRRPVHKPAPVPAPSARTAEPEITPGKPGRPRLEVGDTVSREGLRMVATEADVMRARRAERRRKNSNKTRNRDRRSYELLREVSTGLNIIATTLGVPQSQVLDLLVYHGLRAIAANDIAATIGDATYKSLRWDRELVVPVGEIKLGFERLRDDILQVMSGKLALSS